MVHLRLEILMIFWQTCSTFVLFRIGKVGFSRRKVECQPRRYLHSRDMQRHAETFRDNLLYCCWAHILSRKPSGFDFDYSFAGWWFQTFFYFP